MVTRHTDEFSYTPTEAAPILRVSPTRVRQLLQDGELDGERDEAGHWLIPARVVHERLEHLRHESFLEAVGYDPSIVHATQERVEVLRDQVELLREQLAQANERDRENRRIIAALTQRVPEIEPPREPEATPDAPGSPEAATEQPGRVGPQPEVEGPQEGAEPRPWWRRVFGG